MGRPFPQAWVSGHALSMSPPRTQYSAGVPECLARGLPGIMSTLLLEPSHWGFEVCWHRVLNAPIAADLGVWACGDQVITVDAAARWNASRAGCQAACVDAAASLALPSQYYWAPSAWAACTVLCGGGQQLRATPCMNSVDGSCAFPACRSIPGAMAVLCSVHLL